MFRSGQRSYAKRELFDAAFENFEIVGLEFHVAVGFHIQRHAGPVGVRLTGLLDENVVELSLIHISEPTRRS